MRYFFDKVKGFLSKNLGLYINECIKNKSQCARWEYVSDRRHYQTMLQVDNMCSKHNE